MKYSFKITALITVIFSTTLPALSDTNSYINFDTELKQETIKQKDSDNSPTGCRPYPFCEDL